MLLLDVIVFFVAYYYNHQLYCCLVTADSVQCKVGILQHQQHHQSMRCNWHLTTKNGSNHRNWVEKRQILTVTYILPLLYE